MRLVVTVSLLAVFTAQPALADMYKWVDEKGITQYGDTIPPQYARQGNEQLNNRGIVIKKTKPALTPEQIKTIQEDEAREKEEKRKAEEQKRNDQALLNTYTSTGEIDLTRDRNLQQVELQARSTQLRVKFVQDRLDSFRKQTDTIKRNKKTIPPDLADDIVQTNKEMQHLNEIMARIQKDKAAILARFAEEKRRYLELTKGGVTVGGTGKH